LSRSSKTGGNILCVCSKIRYENEPAVLDIHQWAKKHFWVYFLFPKNAIVLSFISKT